MMSSIFDYDDKIHELTNKFYDLIYNLSNEPILNEDLINKKIIETQREIQMLRTSKNIREEVKNIYTTNLSKIINKLQYYDNITDYFILSPFLNNTI